MPLIRAARASIDRRRDSTVSLPPSIDASPAEVRQPTRAQTLPGRLPRRQVGTLVVVVLKAKNLPDKHVVSKQNPYTKITYDGQTLITAVDKRGGQHPVWDEELRFTVHVDAPTLAEDGSVITPGLPTSMDISLWANEGDHADLLGGTVIDVADTLKRGEFDEWIPLYRNDTQRGDVFLEMTYFSALPPSLGRLSLQCDVASPTAPVELSPPGQILQEPKATEDAAFPPPPPVNVATRPMIPASAPAPTEPVLPGGFVEDAAPAFASVPPAPVRARPALAPVSPAPARVRPAAAALPAPATALPAPATALPAPATVHPTPTPASPGPAPAPALPTTIPAQPTTTPALPITAPAAPADTVKDVKEAEPAKRNKLRKLTKARPSESSLSSQSEVETPPPATPITCASPDVLVVAEAAAMPGGFESVEAPEEPKKEGGLLSSLLESVSGILHSHETKA